MTRRVVVVGFVLLVGLLVNVAYQPDVGTAAERSERDPSSLPGRPG